MIIKFVFVNTWAVSVIGCVILVKVGQQSRIILLNDTMRFLYSGAIYFGCILRSSFILRCERRMLIVHAMLIFAYQLYESKSEFWVFTDIQLGLLPVFLYTFSQDNCGTKMLSSQQPLRMCLFESTSESFTMFLLRRPSLCPTNSVHRSIGQSYREFLNESVVNDSTSHE